MIDYIIKKDDNLIYVCQDNYYLVLDTTFQKYINKILLKKLTNLEALEKCTRKVFGFKNKIPLYLDGRTLLLCIMSYRMPKSMYLNFYAISKFEKLDSFLVVYFHSGHCLKLEEKHAFYNQMKKAREVEEFIYFDL
ncbi:MAG: competence protein ComK [Candidatus Izemoplasmatales bacterium]|jgi:hypothetical protein|nr:competence protein ComK [Candidatus Izemoplasmatales bacterium]